MRSFNVSILSSSGISLVPGGIFAFSSSIILWIYISSLCLLYLLTYLGTCPKFLCKSIYSFFFSKLSYFLLILIAWELSFITFSILSLIMFFSCRSLSFRCSFLLGTPTFLLPFLYILDLAFSWDWFLFLWISASNLLLLSLVAGYSLLGYLESGFSIWIGSSWWSLSILLAPARLLLTLFLIGRPLNESWDPCLFAKSKIFSSRGDYLFWGGAAP